MAFPFCGQFGWFEDWFSFVQKTAINVQVYMEVQENWGDYLDNLDFIWHNVNGLMFAQMP